LKSQDGFHDDQLCQLFADGEAGVADLADEIILAGDEADDLVFAEADFPKAILNFRSGAKLFDSDRDARFHAAQRTNFAVRFLCQTGCRIDVHGKSFAQWALAD
jgi:hypothetical protein